MPKENVRLFYIVSPLSQYIISFYGYFAYKNDRPFLNCLLRNKLLLQVVPGLLALPVDVQLQHIQTVFFQKHPVKQP